MKRALLVLALWLGTSTAQADTRVALVIGNGAYKYVDALTNPRLDARAMKAALERLGFKVVYGEDLDQKHLGQKIAEFAGVAQGADVALTYYAGHGSTFGDMSYLVPIDAEFKSLEGVTYELVPLEQMLGELRRARGIRIAIVDACRDNAKERELKRVAQRGGTASRGLARVQSPDGLILAFSTQYGMTAADGAANTNSPFTAALLRQLPTPGLDVRDVFFNAGRDVVLSTNNAQRPAIEVSLYDRYALVPAPPAGVLSSVPPTPAPAQPAAQMAALPPVAPAPVVTPTPAVNPRRQELISACDRLAARSLDSDLQAGINGVAFGQIDASAAVPACRAAVEATQVKPTALSWLARLSSTGAEQSPVEERRMRFQFGRALDAGKHYTEAKAQYEQARTLGSAAAMTSMGFLYQNGQGVTQDYAAARSWYEKAADKGDPTAMNNLGGLYQNGQGVAQDYAAARSWYEKAAGKDLPDSMTNLGTLYADGQGVAEDYAAALHWYEKAAEKGEPKAMVFLAKLYGIGVELEEYDVAVPRKWYERAAEKGEPEAMMGLGDWYANPQNEAHDYTAASRWYEKAAEKGQPKAMVILGDLYANGRGVMQNYAAARRWYEKAAEEGQPEAMVILGDLYANGQGVTQDDAAARRWYEKAAEKGQPRAMVILGDLYANGQGVTQDDAAARNWFKKAAAAGNGDAWTRLRQLPNE